ncbi:MAG: 23S rRNA (uracil(1939)-C(5))-methyltransferase RlmD [Clostridia bacterium]|nr:23S rRNA (uracil(1939)-C(5))-methyltransferase RlmD [Clostridia bacterium]
MRKNDEFIGNVSAVGSNMEGIVRIDNYVCFVPFALLGEKIKFKVLKTTKNIAFCKLIEVLTPAEQRVRPRCCVYGKCGGCQLQHLRYKDQLKIKTDTVSDCLRKVAGIETDVLPCIKSDNEYEYRNKLQLPVRNINGENKIGFFALNSHRVVETESCPIQKPWSTDIIKVFSEFIEETGISCYNEEKNEGLIRHVVVRQVDVALIITVVINGETLPETKLLIDKLALKFKKFSLFINENTSQTNVILGEKFTCVYGEPSFFTEEFGIKYEVVPQSFMQVNSYIKKKLYQDVVKTLSADKDTTVIDAYSGAGLMTALLSNNAKHVYGIEIVKEAVLSANKLVKDNGLASKVDNICAPCEEELPKLIEKLRQNGDKISVVLDPPRKGCDRKVLDALLLAKPDKIVYVSCSPQTLARDLGILTGSLHYEGNELKKSQEYEPMYTITKVQPYDMFSQTKHVETVVCLSKR